MVTTNRTIAVGQRLVSKGAIVLMLTSPVDAHCFRYWAFPWPQHCVREKSLRPPQRFPPIVSRFPIEQEIPLPDVTFVPMDEPDEATRARLLLRAALGQ